MGTHHCFVYCENMCVYIYNAPINHVHSLLIYVSITGVY